MARVVVGMSGGVDSSVAAALLKEQGYDVVGIMLRLWSEPGEPEPGERDSRGVRENACCSLEAVGDARRVAAQLDIPFYVINVEEAFRRTIVDYFYDEYAAGRTPNPCLRCNKHMRFTVLLERALALGADYLATGHYARVDTDPRAGRRRLRRALDATKDQSYVLHVLDQHQLRHALFPLGDYTKQHVRAMAAARGLPVAAKAESQELCFVAANDYRGFMGRYARATGRAAPASGAITDLRGRELGRHTGLAHYTVGQRKGLGITAREPLHVIRLDATRNTIVVGPAAALECASFRLRDVTYTAGEVPPGPFDAEVKIRYKAPPTRVRVTPLAAAHAAIQLSEPQRAVTPGQAAVLYGGATGDEVLGGGLIETAAMAAE